MTDVDVVVVGARCAGASLAIRLARAGLRVCVLDRARFPSDTPSTHVIQPTGVRVLAELGCADELMALTQPLVTGTLVMGEVRIELGAEGTDLDVPGINVRRVTLDAVLLRIAEEAGADVRTRTAVTGLLTDEGRVTGVVTDAGPIRARLVVGADGARSTVARMVGAEEYGRTEPGRLFLWTYLDGTSHPPGHMWIGRRSEYAFLASPTDGGKFLTAVAVDMHRRDAVLVDRPGAFATALREWPELESIVAGGRRAGPIHAVPRWHGFFRRSAGPGWALVGDAGHFKDPSPGQGIADALRQSTRLAEGIVAGLGGAEAPDAALARWWSWRDRDAWPMYRFAATMGAPGPVPPLVEAMLQAVADDPRRTNDLLRVLDHELSPDALFTPGLAVGVLGRALVRRHGRQHGRRRELLREARGLAAAEARRRVIDRSAARRIPVGA